MDMVVRTYVYVSIGRGFATRKESVQHGMDVFWLGMKEKENENIVYVNERDHFRHAGRRHPLIISHLERGKRGNTDSGRSSTSRKRRGGETATTHYKQGETLRL